MKKRLLNFGLPFFAIIFAFAIGLKASPDEEKIVYIQSPQVIFSPRGKALDRICELIQLSQKKIDVAAYAFNSETIARSLIAADQRGINVRVISDRYNKNRYPTLMITLALSGVEVYYDHRHATFHNKFIVIDDRIILTGSYNYTNAAEYANAENLLIIDNKFLAEQYETNFETHLLHSEPSK